LGTTPTRQPRPLVAMDMDIGRSPSKCTTSNSPIWTYVIIFRDVEEPDFELLVGCNSAPCLAVPFPCYGGSPVHRSLSVPSNAGLRLLRKSYLVPNCKLDRAHALQSQTRDHHGSFASNSYMTACNCKIVATFRSAVLETIDRVSQK
jgi:hypothetical protein